MFKKSKIKNKNEKTDGGTPFQFLFKGLRLNGVPLRAAP